MYAVMFKSHATHIQSLSKTARYSINIAEGSSSPQTTITLVKNKQKIYKAFNTLRLGDEAQRHEPSFQPINEEFKLDIHIGEICVNRFMQEAFPIMDNNDNQLREVYRREDGIKEQIWCLLY